MPKMVKKDCSYCGKATWHNPTSVKYSNGGQWRCTSCGYPPTSNTQNGRKEIAERHMRKIAGRLV